MKIYFLLFALAFSASCSNGGGGGSGGASQQPITDSFTLQSYTDTYWSLVNTTPTLSNSAGDYRMTLNAGVAASNTLRGKFLLTNDIDMSVRLNHLTVISNSSIKLTLSLENDSNHGYLDIYFYYSGGQHSIDVNPTDDSGGYVSATSCVVGAYTTLIRVLRQNGSLKVYADGVQCFSDSITNLSAAFSGPMRPKFFFNVTGSPGIQNSQSIDDYSTANANYTVSP